MSETEMRRLRRVHGQSVRAAPVAGLRAGCPSRRITWTGVRGGRVFERLEGRLALRVESGEEAYALLGRLELRVAVLQQGDAALVPRQALFKSDRPVLQAPKNLLELGQRGLKCRRIGHD